MATVLLAAAGNAIGASIGGGIFGISSAVIGQAIGATIGSAIDQRLFGPTVENNIEGSRLSDSNITSSAEGLPIIRGYGRFRVAGNIIWASRLREDVVVDTQTEGGKGGGGTVTTTTTTYNYYANFAIALCEGKIQDVHRIWIDGKLADLTNVTYRVYKGTETQTPDSLIETKEGSGNAPAYRGVAYIVFEDLLLTKYGNRIPQFQVEITRPVIRSDNDSVSQLVKGVDLIPGTTEFGYDPDVVDQVIYGGSNGNKIVERRKENNHSTTDSNISDWDLAMDQLEAALPNCGVVTLVVSWFGTDLRIGNCDIQPQVENNTKKTDPYSWKVTGLTRTTATVISTYDGKPAFGGTPNDASVIRAIQDLKARGFEVMFYPFIIMDIASGNSLPNPYSDNAAGVGQPVYPWRGRITCSPAPGYVGTVDKTATATTQINAFVGSAAAGDFSTSGTTVTYSGPSEWSFRRMILHYAHLCDLAGGVEYFCIGTEMVGATTIRNNTNAFPFVDALVTLAGDVAGILSSSEIGYAADWSEYHSYRPGDGSNDVYFHLDKLWANASIDFIGIDNYLPMSDWRDGVDHLDYIAGYNSIYDVDYLKANIENGEYFDWYYNSASDRAAQTRTAISDGLYSRPFVYRQKDIKGWWQTAHHNRPDGILSGLVSDGYDPRSWMSIGSPTVANESGTFLGKYTLAVRVASSTLWHRVSTISTFNMGVGDTATVVAFVEQGTSNIAGVYADINGDTRVEYNFSTQATTKTETGGNVISNISVTDHGSGVFEISFDVTAGAADATSMVSVGPRSSSGDDIVVIGAYVLKADESSTLWTPEGKKIYFTEFGCPAINKGTNQPNVFYDPKSSESFAPYFSSGARDDEIQRQYIRAMIEYWGDAANNPTSSVYAAKMIDTDKLIYWSFDARPWPSFPSDGDTWADQQNWSYGHWISGRIDTVYMPDLLTMIAEDYNITFSFDFTRAYGSCDGFIIQNTMSFRSAIEPLASLFMFDIIESGDTIKAVSHIEAQPVATVDLDDLSDAGEDEVIMVSRMQETELPKAMTVRFIDIFKDYEPSAVSQSREVVEAESSPVTDTPVVLDFARGQQIVDRLLYSAWSRRETSEFGLLPEFMKVEPGDVIKLNAQGFTQSVRVQSITEGEIRKIGAQSFNLGIFGGAGISARTQKGIPANVSTAPVVAFMDLPMLYDTDTGYKPYTAGYVTPWPGVNIYKSITSSNYGLDSQLTGPAYIGETTALFSSGSTDVWDNANTMSIVLYSGALSSQSEDSVLNGANAIAIENSTGGWEVLQFVTATLTGTLQYDLTQLLRGQLGTEDNMEDNIPVGARVVVLNLAVGQLDMSLNDIGREYYFKYGPSDKDIGDTTYTVEQHTFYARGLWPYSPVHVEGVDSSGDMVISWVRRTRVQGDSWDQTEVPLGETNEEYEVDVLNGSNVVVRTLSVTDATTVTYTAAQQATDGISAPFDVIIYQLSENVGRGVGRRATLNG